MPLFAIFFEVKMRFFERLGILPQDAIFEEEDYFVWCSSLVRHADTYYLFYSRWKREYGFEAWVTHSEIALASSKQLFGRFRFEKVLFSKEESNAWDRDCFHNPTVLQKDGKYYLYYMGNFGNGSFWDHRNHQRIGLAVADHPMGEWKRLEKPLIDVSEDGFDCLMTSNPSVTELPDGRIAMIYKGVAKEKPLPAGGPVVCGMAFADSPEGPFRKTGIPVMKNPQHPWSVEDPFLFVEHQRLFALAKDFHGYFTGTGCTSLALFESLDGVDFVPAEHPLAMELKLPMRNGEMPVRRLERPQIYFEDGIPKALLLAVLPIEAGDDTEASRSFSVRLPILHTGEKE